MFNLCIGKCVEYKYFFLLYESEREREKESKNIMKKTNFSRIGLELRN